MRCGRPYVCYIGIVLRSKVLIITVRHSIDRHIRTKSVEIKSHGVFVSRVVDINDCRSVALNRLARVIFLIGEISVSIIISIV